MKADGKEMEVTLGIKVETVEEVLKEKRLNQYLSCTNE